ncbi:hypothetical protein NL676_006232 [Syzygium grande]|nr:hypothetical protein NL676_006232 [Syzygium grande]
MIRGPNGPDQARRGAGRSTITRAAGRSPEPRAAASDSRRRRRRCFNSTSNTVPHRPIAQLRRGFAEKD